MKEETKRKLGRAIAWVLLGVLVLIVVPLGAAACLISAVISAADRVFNSSGEQ